MLNGRKIVSLCTSRLNDIDNIRFIMQLNKGLKELNASLFIYNVSTDLYWSDDNIRAESAVFGLVDMQMTDVVIVMYERIKNKTVTDKVIESAHRHNVPVIIVDAQRDDCISICFDYTLSSSTELKSHIFSAASRGISSLTSVWRYSGRSSRRTA